MYTLVIKPSFVSFVTNSFHQLACKSDPRLSLPMGSFSETTFHSQTFHSYTCLIFCYKQMHGLVLKFLFEAIKCKIMMLCIVETHAYLHCLAYRNTTLND